MGFPLVLALLGIGCRSGALSGVGKNAYVEQNELLLRSVPTFPGATLLETSSDPYYRGDGAGAPVAGYTTTQVYELPAEATAGKVANFYRDRLSGEWRLVEELPAQPPTGPVLNFRRGRASLSVNLENASFGRVEVTVDQEAHGNQRTGSI